MRLLSDDALIGLPGNFSVIVVLTLLDGAAAGAVFGVAAVPGAGALNSGCVGAEISCDSSPSSQPLPFSGGGADFSSAFFSSAFGVAGGCSFVSAFEGGSDTFSALGADFSAAYLKIKHDEWNNHCAQFTRWEHQTTLDI